MTTYNSQMFYLGNFADMDTDEANTAAENANLITGTYVKPMLANVTIEDTDSDGVLHDDETAGGSFNPAETADYDIGAGPTQQYIDSTIVYDVVVLLGDGSTTTINGTVIQLQNGDVFLTDYANNGSMDNLSIQSLTLSNPVSNYTGFFANSSVSGATVVCFGAGTRVLTPSGDCLVEDLRADDLVVTRDHGPQSLVAVVSRSVPKAAKDSPVTIQAGALGPNVPDRRLRLSPNHRVLTSGPIVVRMFCTPAVFVAAKALLDLPGVTQGPKLKDERYCHLLGTRHAVIWANGCPAETLYPGGQALTALVSDQTGQRVAHHLSSAAGTFMAHPEPPLRQQRRLVQRCLQNEKPICQGYSATVV